MSDEFPVELPPEVQFRERIFSEEDSARLVHAIRGSIEWRQERMRFGALMPRLTAWYGDEGAYYNYSGIRHLPLPWTLELLEVKKRVEQLLQVSFQGVLMNLYRDGQDSIGWHSDDEPEMGPTIASVSLGATRTFQFRSKEAPHQRFSLPLTDGSLLVMRGRTQLEWCHRIRKEAALGERINLNFREVIVPSV